MKIGFSVTGGKLSLELPAKADKPTPAGTQAIRNTLLSITAYHPQALTTYTYYEVIDQWLGPWGPEGYPLGYGKYYNILFNQNEALSSNTDARKWVEETTVKLQEALTEYIAKRFASGTLGGIAERELREAAFDSHPKAYTDGGLPTVVLLDPLLVPIIAWIPKKEFNPRAPSFRATIRQVLITAAMVAPGAMGMLVAAAMPAHSGLFQVAAARDARRYLDLVNFGSRLGEIRSAIQSGRLDYEPWLDELIAQLNRGRYDSQDAARAVREVIGLAENRKKYVRQQHEELLKGAPQEVREGVLGR